MSKTASSKTQARLRKETAERDARMAKQKADRLEAEAAAKVKKTDELEQHAKRVAALYKSMREFEAHAEEKAGFELQKAAEKRAALEQALVEAHELCKAASEDFKAFQQKYAPDYKRTRLYQILAIADGRKTAEGIREEEREKKRRQRAGRSVRDKSDVPDKVAEGEAALKSGEEGDTEPASNPAGAPEPPTTPVLTASAERPLEQVKAAGAALADEAPAEPPTNGHAADGFIPPGDDHGGEAAPPAEPSSNGKPDDDRSLAEKLERAVNVVWALCSDTNNWPHLSANKERELRAAMKKLGELREILPRLATPSKSKLH